MAIEIEKPTPISSELSSVIESYTDSEYFQQRVRSENSKTAYRADLGLFATYLNSAGVLSLRDVKIDHLAGWVEQMSGHRAAATVERRLSSVKTFLKWLVENNLSQENFRAKVTIAKDSRTLPFEVLGNDRYMALVEHLRREGELRDLAIVELLISTGAGTTEIVNMNIGDISELKRGQ